ncbi:MAG: PLP-dependent lyase/thiolase [Candidatus Paceibacteria bacterium]
MLTPQKERPQIANELDVDNIVLKREDKNPYGSHKGRSIPLMIEEYLKQEKDKFVISSSGNAALAAVKKAQELSDKNKDIVLEVFVGKDINKNKLNQIKQNTSEKITIKRKQRPKQAAFQKGKNQEWVYLRQSTDDLALKGYKQLAKELDNIENLQAVFIPTSSGTTAQGVFEGFTEAIDKPKEVPEIHIAQTEYCHPIAEEFDQDFKKQKNTSIASAIVDKVAHRKKKVIEAVKSSSGSGWVLSDKQIKQAKNMTKEITGLDISANSALSIAATQKAKEKDCSWNGTVCCLICGE